jgi:hypothetical protein
MDKTAVETEISMPRRTPRTIMGLAALRPVRQPALARFLQLPIPCVYSLYRYSVVYVQSTQVHTSGPAKEIRAQTVRLLTM